MAKSSYSELRSYLKGLTYKEKALDYASGVDFDNLKRRFPTMEGQFFYVMDYVKTEIVFISKGVKKVLGYDHDEITIDLLYDIIHTEDLDVIKQATKRSVEIAYQPPYEKPMEHVFTWITA